MSRFNGNTEKTNHPKKTFTGNLFWTRGSSFFNSCSNDILRFSRRFSIFASRIPKIVNKKAKTRTKISNAIVLTLISADITKPTKAPINNPTML